MDKSGSLDSNERREALKQDLRFLVRDSIILIIVFLTTYFFENRFHLFERVEDVFRGLGFEPHTVFFSMIILFLMLLVFTTLRTLAVRREVARRRDIEKALKMEHKRAQEYLDVAAVMIVFIDAHQRVQLLNKKGFEIVGYSEQEILGKNWFETCLSSAKRDEIRMAFINMMAEQIEPYTSFECWIRTKDKGQRLLVLQNALVRDSEGEIQGMLASGQDITERREAEIALALKSEELERSNRELEQFAYIASHDLQEPLRLILSFVDLLSLKIEDRLDEDTKEYMSYITKSASWMQRLINDLLTYSRVTTRASPFEQVSLNEILAQATFNLKTTIDDTKTVITDSALPEVMADKTQMIQVFQNLLGNAIKFCDKDHPEISVSAESRDDSWRISFKDNGIGIDMKYAPRIFKVFERLHPKETYPGTGIGLAICKKIVERHRGKIEMESELKKGSVFIVTLPKIKE